MSAAKPTHPYLVGNPPTSRLCGCLSNPIASCEHSKCGVTMILLFNRMKICNSPQGSCRMQSPRGLLYVCNVNVSIKNSRLNQNFLWSCINLP